MDQARLVPDDPVFDFRQCMKLLKSTGKKASSLNELMRLIRVASDNSIYHHTHEYFFRGRILEYTNEFARWVGENLEAHVLAENLSVIDPFRHGSIASLRDELLNKIEAYIKKFPSPGKVFSPGEEFFFQETVTFVFPTEYSASSLEEFVEALKKVDDSSIYWHFYEGRVRVEGGVNDFSNWVGDSLGLGGLSDQISSIDPFMHSIGSIREQITGYCARELEKGKKEGAAV